MRRKSLIYLIAISALSLIIVGCNKGEYIEKRDDIEVVEEFEDMVFEDKENIYDIKKYVKENIPRLNNLEISSSMINTYIYSLYEKLETYINIVSTLQEDFIDIEEELGIDVLDDVNQSSIPDNYKIVKAVLNELEDNYFILVKENNAYVIDVDIEKIYREYSKYMNKDTSNYLKFRISEKKKDIYDINSDTYNIQLLLDTANNICKNIENLEGDSQKENWVQTLMYYLNVITSKSQNTFLDNNNKILIEKYNEIKKEQSKYKNTEFGKFLDDYLKLLSENDYKTDSDNVTSFLNTVESQLESFLIEKK